MVDIFSSIQFTFYPVRDGGVNQELGWEQRQNWSIYGLTIN